MTKRKPTVHYWIPHTAGLACVKQLRTIGWPSKKNTKEVTCGNCKRTKVYRDKT